MASSHSNPPLAVECQSSTVLLNGEASEKKEEFVYGYFKQEVVPKFWRGWNFDPKIFTDRLATFRLFWSTDNTIPILHRYRLRISPEKYEREAHKYWDKFYKRNQANFFKDRHWIDREFMELARSNFEQQQEQQSSSKSISTLDDSKSIALDSGTNTSTGNQLDSIGTSHPSESQESLESPIPGKDMLVALEVGCGVGNTIFPLLETNPNLFFFGFDFAPSAIALVKKNPLYTSTKRCSGFVVDIVKDQIPEPIKQVKVDIATMIFVLSAISPQHHDNVIEKLAEVVKPGGLVMFRDYALGDLAQQRFDGKEEAPQKIEDNFYVRTDGTRAYYFSEEELSGIMIRNGFEVVECTVVEKMIENRKKGLQMKRLWIQGKFCRKSSS